jgi:hypothetical protein
MVCRDRTLGYPCLLSGVHCVFSIEIDTLEYQQTEKIKTELKDFDTSKQVYAALSRVSFWGIPFTQYHIRFLPCRQPPLKKGSSQMESSVQDNPAAPSPCQMQGF